MDASIFYEGALSGRYQRVHVRCNPGSQDFGNDFGDGMNQANGAEI